MSDKIILNEDDVVSLNLEDSITSTHTSTVSEITAKLKHWIHQNSSLNE